jgi:PST family polysaccharide transporter
MNLVRTSLLSALAVLTKLASSLFLSKVLAIYVGPSGYGVIGQFQSLISMVTTFASGATNSGVTKYTAEYAAEPARQQAVWTTAAAMGLLGALVVGCALVLAREQLSRWLLGSSAQSDVFVWLALALGLLVLNGLMLAILTGRKAVSELVAANIVGSVVSALVATVLVTTQGLWGALVALAVSQAVACGFTAWIFQRVCALRWSELIGKFDPGIAKALGGFGLMAATTAVVAPIGQMVIRDQLAANLGWESAGLWQALWKISETHLLLLTSTLAVYFLPRFSEIRSGSELRSEVFKGYLFVVPMVAASGMVLYYFRETLIRILLTEAFMPLAQVLGLQLLGDALKICSWVMSFTMVSHARTRAFIVTEVLFTVIYVLAVVVLARYYGLAGTAIAYGATYLIYWATVYWLFRDLVARLRREEAAALKPSRLQDA